MVTCFKQSSDLNQNVFSRCFFLILEYISYFCHGYDTLEVRFTTLVLQDYLHYFMCVPACAILSIIRENTG